ncbi:MAG: ABC transporter ATP-binding protein [Candidatus Dormibacteraeota bacterium]|nr:ABC transporter ATP-binding protein [Candidatus Dormibacteraeota bacterium]
MSQSEAAASPLPAPMRLRGVTKAYRTTRETTSVLRELDLDLHRGEIVCLVGASGSGKSTLISVIAGLLRADAGSVFIDGHDVSELSDSQRAHLRATKIGLVLQSGNLVPFLTAAENVALATRLAGTEVSSAHVASLLEQVGLADRADHLPRRLSGGEAQRVALAIALANEPDVLLADEAVGQLDSSTAKVVLRTIERACEERQLAVLLVTHSDEIAALGSRTLRLNDGQLETAS